MTWEGIPGNDNLLTAVVAGLVAAGASRAVLKRQLADKRRDVPPV